MSRARFLLGCFVCALAACAGEEEPARGLLVLSGGGTLPAEALERVAQHVGFDAPVALIPDASEEPEEAAATARGRFTEAGFTDCRIVRIANDADELARCKVAYLGGGDQARLMDRVREGSADGRLAQLLRRGGVVIGHSAGTAVVGRVMITGKGSGDRAEAGAVETAPGLGLIAAVVDQHFVARARFTRLLVATLDSRERIGIGVDEATAAIVSEGTELEVVGSGTVTVIDARDAEVARADPGQAVAARGLRVHVLRRGDRWSLKR